MSEMITAEAAVRSILEQPEYQQLAHDAYFDGEDVETARRFSAGQEWQEVAALLPTKTGTVLDVGAGRGISSYAFASIGWQSIALEPDPSTVIGAGAVQAIQTGTQLPIEPVRAFGESLPFRDSSFEVVYCRQVLHHAYDLEGLCREIGRVLKPGGKFIATREHVLSRHEDLDQFLENHPLHHMTQAEHAFLLEEYQQAIRGGGLTIRKVWGLYDSAINYYPMSYGDWWKKCRRIVARYVGDGLAKLLTDARHPVGRFLLGKLAARLTRRSNVPGRMYSFVAEKPLR